MENETIHVNGKDYSLTGNNDVSLKEVFSFDAVTSGMIPGASEDTFNENVAEYHDNEKYRSLIDSVFAEQGAQSPTLMLYSFSGPGAHKAIAKQARAAGLTTTASKKRGWDRSLTSIMFPVAWAAMTEHYQANKDEINAKIKEESDEDISKYGDTLAELFEATGKYQISGRAGVQLERKVNDEVYERQVSMAVKCEIWDVKRLTKDKDKKSKEGSEE